jgi:4'-phosphopantetheinyl transferase
VTSEFPGKTLSLSENNVDIWLAYYNYFDEQILTRLGKLLNPDEKRRQQRYHFADDKKRYLVTRALVRTVLSKYSEVAPTTWTFVTNRYGRPEIAERHKSAKEISFNISHTSGLIALAITYRRAVGIDVENILSRPASIGIADHFFSSTEAADLSRIPPHQKQERFFEYWVCKESYVKARGMGLSIPLDRFSFTFPDERSIQIAIQPELGDCASRWSFRQYRPSPEHLLAVCFEHMTGKEPVLTIRKTIPYEMEELLELQLQKTSKREKP